MLPLQDELLVSFLLVDRHADADRARLARSVLPGRASRARRAVASLGQALVRLGARLEAVGGAPVSAPPDARPALAADRLTRC